MSRALSALFAPVLTIKPDEWRRAVLMFLYFFFTMTSYYILKPVRNALFLESHGAENLPYIWLLTIGVLWVVASVYVRFASILKKHVLMSWTIASFVAHILIFWWLAAFSFRWTSIVFYVWVSIFSSFTVTQFWLFANDLFDPREAKRLFGFVGSGGILGGMVGGSLTSWLVHALGARNLLIVAAFILAACIFIINLVWQFEGERIVHLRPSAPRGAEPPPIGTRQLLGTIGRTRYLMLLVGIVVFAKTVSTLIEFQFNVLVESHVAGLNERTGFFGAFYRWLNIVALVVQFFLTSRILRTFGVGAALSLLPLGLAGGSLATLLAPSLWTGAFTMMYDGSMNYSLNQSTREVLYLPIEREVRYRVKPLIDMVFYRLSKAVGSLLVLLTTKVLDLSVRQVALLPLAMAGAWMACIVAMRKEYVHELRRFLARETEVKTVGARSTSEVALAQLALSDLASMAGERAAALGIFQLAGREEFRTLLKAIGPLEGANAPARLREVLADALSQRGSASERSDLEHLLDEASQEDVAAFAAVLGSVSARRRAVADLTASAQAVSGRCAALALERARGAGARVRIFAGAFLLWCGLAREEALRLLAETLAAPPEAKPRSSVFAHLADLRHRFEEATQLVDWVGHYLEEGTPAGEQLAVPEVGERLRAVRLLEVCAHNRELPHAKRRRLPELLARFPSQEAVDALMALLAETADADFRLASVKALNKLRAQAPQLTFRADPLQAALASELATYDLAVRLGDVYRELAGEPGPAAGEVDAFLIVLRERTRETQERIFRLVGLLGDPESAELVYRGLQSQNPYLRANALEFLDNVASPELRKRLMAVLDSDVETRGAHSFPAGRAGLGAEERLVFLERLALERDPWFTLASLYLARRFRLRALGAAARVQAQEAAGLARGYAASVADELEVA